MQIPLFKPQTEWLPPENFPDLSKYDEIGCKVNNDSQLIDLLQFENGQMICEFTVPSNTQEESFLVELWVQSSHGNHYSTNFGTVFIDRESPLLILELKDVLRLDSNDLSRVLFEGTVVESSTLINKELTVNWDLMRDGLMLNQVPFSGQIALNTGADGVYQFSNFIEFFLLLLRL